MIPSTRAAKEAGATEISFRARMAVYDDSRIAAALAAFGVEIGAE
jgi:hypothetical protein